LRDYLGEYCIKFELFYIDSNCNYGSAIALRAGLSMRKRPRAASGLGGLRAVEAGKTRGTAGARGAAKPTIVAPAFTRR
jgi:hypothetical protein